MEGGNLKILITGARGFVGRNLVEYLAKECARKCALFYPFHTELELLDTEKVSEFINDNNIDIIVHCAYVGGSRKTAYDINATDIVAKNFLMFCNLARNLDSRRRMIFLGSGAEYDFRYYKPRMHEGYFGKHVPDDAYGFSKYACSKYIEKSENIINLRLFGIYGKYEAYEYRFISNAILKNILGLPIVINQNVYFDYLYVNDLVKIIEYFIMHKTQYKFYNVGTGKTIDLITIANKINRISTKPSRIIIKNKGLNAEYSADNARLLKVLKGYKFTPFDQALEELYSFHRGNLANVDRVAIKKDEYLKFCRANF